MHHFQMHPFLTLWNAGTGAAFRLRPAISAAFLSCSDGVSQSHWTCWRFASRSNPVTEKAMEIHGFFPKCSIFLVDFHIVLYVY